MINAVRMLCLAETEAQEVAMNIRRRARGTRGAGATRRALARAIASAPTEASRHELEALGGRD
jgi:hypothetical protein